MALDKISFFSAVDRKDKREDGAITSQFPAWYFKEHLGKMIEEKERLENDIAMGRTPAEKLVEKRKEAKDIAQRIDDIRKSQPKLSVTDKGGIEKVYNELGRILSETLPRYTDMQKGFTNIHQEANMMTERTITVDPTVVALFKNNGCKVTQNKVSRNDVAKMWKIIGCLLGEPTNVETLRRDHVGHAYKIEPKLEELQ